MVEIGVHLRPSAAKNSYLNTSRTLLLRRGGRRGRRGVGLACRRLALGLRQPERLRLARRMDAEGGQLDEARIGAEAAEVVIAARLLHLAATDLVVGLVLGEVGAQVFQRAVV